jgi:hypothetical protein
MKINAYFHNSVQDLCSWLCILMCYEQADLACELCVPEDERALNGRMVLVS